MKEEKDDGEFEFLLCLDRLPSRNDSSMSCSSRSYYRSTGGVPFQWEMHPGTPKNDNAVIPPLRDAVAPPPISPPPAALSRGLPKPFFVGRRRGSGHPLFGSWRKQSKSFDQRFRSCGSDRCDFMDQSPSKATSSSSSSLSSTSKDPPLPPARSSGRWRLGCVLWSINTIKTAIGRRL